MSKKVLGVVVALVLVGVAVWMLRTRPSDEAGEGARPSPTPMDRGGATPRAERAAPSPVRPDVEPGARPADEVEAPPVALPSLHASDAFVREQIEGFGLPEEWVERDDLLRHLAVLVDNARIGEIPRRQFRFVKPKDSFRVVERDGRLYADPRNYLRFDPYLDRLEKIEPERLAGLLTTLRPLLDEAFAELGSSSRGDRPFLEAIDRVLELPVAPADFELVQRKVLYEYADEGLEALPPVEKQMLRLGPRNLARFQRYLGALREALVRAQP